MANRHSKVEAAMAIGSLQMPEPMNVIELAFRIEDPCSDVQIQLAAAILALIAGRDDTECLALTHEMRALALKYPRFRPKPVMSTSG